MTDAIRTIGTSFGPNASHYGAPGVGYLEQAQVKSVSYAPMRHHLAGLSWTATGYGRKIPTRYMVTVAGKSGHRKHRVYAVIFGNSGSLYVIIGGEALYLTLDVEHALQGL